MSQHGDLPHIPAQRSGPNARSTPRTTSSKEALQRRNTLRGWKPSYDEEGKLVLKRPTAENTGRPTVFESALFRYIKASDEEIKTLRSRHITSSTRITELGQELAERQTKVSRLTTELREARRRIDHLLEQERENAARRATLENRAINAERILQLQDLLTKFLEQPMLSTGLVTERLIRRQFAIGGLDFTMTMHSGADYGYHLSVTSNTDIQILSYEVSHFDSTGMPTASELAYLAFLLEAVTEEGYRKNQERFKGNPEALAEIYAPAPPSDKPRGFERVIRALGSTALHDSLLFGEGLVPPANGGMFSHDPLPNLDDPSYMYDLNREASPQKDIAIRPEDQQQ